MRLVPRLPSRFTAVAEEFIKAKVEAAGAQGVVLGLSGGLDSAVVAALCARALDPKNVLAVYLPDENSQKEDEKDARELAKKLKISFKSVHISHDVQALKDSLKEAQLTPNKAAVLNLKARARMALLYGIANTKNYLVAGTSNKSELLVGYFTKYGDGASDFAVIGDLYKTQVRQLAELIDIPDAIMDKPPTAGLAPGQTDEQDLGITYEALDQVLVGLNLALPKTTIMNSMFPARSANVRTITRIEQMVEATAHKRALTKVLKVGMSTVGVDRRETNN